MFIDPFGISHTPFDLIQRFMKNEKCEVLINFMYSYVNRFKDKLPEQITALYGTGVWRDYRDIPPAEREEFLVSLYERQLNSIASYTWSFKMINMRNQPEYILFYGTNNILGLEKMKEAMWKTSPVGPYSFSSREHGHGQTFLFGPEDIANLQQLKEILINRFCGQTVSIEDIERFVLLETDFIKNHIRQKTLVPLERDGKIKVVSQRARRNSYPDGTQIYFCT